MNPPLVDSHCHLNFPDFKEDIEAVIARARAAGVVAMQTICTEMSEFEEVHAIAQAHEGIYCSVGVHPNDSGATELVSVETLVEAASRPKVIGLGETGLDYHYERAERVTQIESFRRHIAASRETGLPVIVHSRDAEEDTVAILREETARGKFPILIHCFTSGPVLAGGALELDAYISIAGVITFKNSNALRAVVKDIPLNRLLIETDSPFLAPVPNRGKRNEPAYVAEVAKAIAELKEVAYDQVAHATTDNFFRLFSKVVA